MSNILEVVLNLIDNLSPTMDSAAETVDGLGDSVDSAGESIDSINADSIEEVGGSAEEAGSEVEGLGEAGTEAGDSIDSIDGSNLDEVASGANEAASNLDSASGSADNLASSLEDVGAGIENAVTTLASLQAVDTLGNLGSDAESFAQNLNDVNITVGQLSTLTGIAEPKLREMVAHISNVTFPQEEALAYISTINQLGGTTEEVFAKTATDMDRINDAYGIGATRVSKLTELLVGMGIPIEDLGQSYNALAYIQANAAGGVDTFSQKLRMLAPDAVASGLSMDQLAIAYAAAAEKAGSAEKGSRELASILRETDGDVRAVEEALGLKAGTLDNATAITGEYAGVTEQLADEEAQHKTIVEQVVAAYEDFQLTNSGLISVLSGTVGALGSVVGAIAPVISAYFLKGIATNTSMAGVAGETAATNISTISQIKEAAMTKLSAAAHLIKAGVLKGVAAAQWLLNAAMSANPIGILIIAIIALVGFLYYLWETNEGFRNALIGAWEAIKGTVMPVIDAIVAGLEWLWSGLSWILGLLFGWSEEVGQAGEEAGGSFVDSILEWFGSLPDLIAEYLGMALEYILNFIIEFMGLGDKAGWDFVLGVIFWIATLPFQIAWKLFEVLLAVSDWALQLLGFGEGAASGFVNAVISFIKNLPANLWAWLLNTIQRVLLWRNQMIQRAKEAGMNFLRNIISFIQQLPSRVWSFLVSTISRISSFASQAISRAVQAGLGIVRGIMSNVTQLPGRVWSEMVRIGGRLLAAGGYLWNKAWQVGKRILDGLLSALGIKSPGFMFYAISDELDRMDKIMNDSKDKLGKTANDLGEEILEGFLEPNMIGNSSMSSIEAVETETTAEITIVHDFKNVPKDVSKEELLEAVKSLPNDDRFMKNLAGSLDVLKNRAKRKYGV